MITYTGRRIVTYHRVDNDLGGISYHCVRPGYCSTIIKYQGAELKHLTLYLDVPGIPGAAYTALLRVAGAECYLIGSSEGVDDLRLDHFAPANEDLLRREGRRAYGGIFQ